MLGWVVFRAPDMTAAGRMYAGMIGMQGSGQLELLLANIGGMSIAVLAISLVMVWGAPGWAAWLQRREHQPWCAALRLLVIPLFLLAIVQLMAESYSPFLYFQF